MLKHFEMYITINNIIGKKRIDLTYSIKGKEVAVVRMSVTTSNMSLRNLGR